jgi:hypothetical protein
MESTFEALEDLGGEEVTYRYAGIELNGVIAVAGKEQSLEPQMGGRTTVTQRTMDFLIHRERLKVGNTYIQPQRGNLITRESGVSYRVLAPNGGPCWRWSEGQEVYYRIQTVRLGEE